MQFKVTINDIFRSLRNKSRKHVRTEEKVDREMEMKDRTVK
jgi:hypothetical protein